LHLATLEQLEAEVLKRKEESGATDDEDEGNNEEIETPKFVPSSAFPERVAILGAGPAGLSAAIYVARAGLAPVVIAPPLGGQLMGKGVNVENYPGIVGGTGPSIIDIMLRQAINYGVVFEPSLATSVNFTKSPFTISTENITIQAHTVILATGADSRWLGVSGEQKYRGGGISSCATCDGFLFRDQPVIIVGGGDTAMEDALVLARTSIKHIKCLYRRDKSNMPGSQREVVNAKEEGVQFEFNVQPIEIVGNKSVEGIKIVKTDLFPTISMGWTLNSN
jgi:thioredoxin reductase